MERRSVDPILKPRVLPRASLQVGVKGTALFLSLLVSAYVTARGLGAPSHSWLAWVALLPLFVAIRMSRPVRAMLYGALWGFCLYVFAADPVGTGLAEGIFSLALLTAIPAIYGFFGSLLTRRIGFNPLVLGVGWMGVVLASEALGMHNGLLTGTQGDGTVAHWLGGALGYVLAAFLVAFVSALLVSVLSRIHVGAPQSRYLPGPVDNGTRLVPHAFLRFPFFAIASCQPRAPPMAPTS